MVINFFSNVVCSVYDTCLSIYTCREREALQFKLHLIFKSWKQCLKIFFQFNIIPFGKYPTFPNRNNFIRHLICGEP